MFTSTEETSQETGSGQGSGGSRRKRRTKSIWYICEGYAAGEYEIRVGVPGASDWKATIKVGKHYLPIDPSRRHVDASVGIEILEISAKSNELRIRNLGSDGEGRFIAPQSFFGAYVAK